MSNMKTNTTQSENSKKKQLTSRRNKGKNDIPNTYIHDRSLYCPDTVTSSP